MVLSVVVQNPRRDIREVRVVWVLLPIVPEQMEYLHPWRFPVNWQAWETRQVWTDQPSSRQR